MQRRELIRIKLQMLTALKFSTGVLMRAGSIDALTSLETLNLINRLKRKTFTV